ncbi:MAG: hypothetical protein U1E73_07600 [Planctomycetota bacterium]
MTNIRISVLTAAALSTTLAAQWAQVTPATAPTARSGAGMCYDGSRLVMFGGSTGFSASNQTWTYDGTTWQQLAPTNSPTGKQGMELIHDPIRGVIVMYGSLNTSIFGGASVDQTWEFDGTTWTQAFPTTTPGGLGIYCGAYDLGRQKVVIYGGEADNFFPIASADTWEYDGTNWTLVTTVGSPGPIERGSMCYFPPLGKIVMFGGIDPQIGGNNTTWTYDGTTWAALAISGPSPAARFGAGLAYDPVRNVLVLAGGGDPMTGSGFTDTWEFNGTSWTQQPTSTAGQAAAAMAFHTGVRKVVRFGGMNPMTGAQNANTLHYGASSRAFGTGCPGSNGTPALAAADAPRLGGSQTLTLTNLNTSAAFAVMVIGLSNTTSAFGALPLPLAAYGMPGCTAYVSTEGTTLIGASAGTAQFVSNLPNNLAFLGLPLYHQCLSLDAAANAGGLTTSNALASIVGH